MTGKIQSVIAIMLSYTTSVISFMHEINFAADVTAFAGAALTLVMAYEKWQNAQHRKQEVDALKIENEHKRFLYKDENRSEKRK